MMRSFLLVSIMGGCVATLLIACSNDTEGAPAEVTPPKDEDAGSGDVDAGGRTTDAFDSGDAADSSTVCTESMISARTDPLNAPGESVLGARIAADGRTVYYAYGTADGGGIKRTDLCGLSSTSIVAEKVSRGFGLANGDVGFFALTDTLYSSPLEPGASKAQLFQANQIALAWNTIEPAPAGDVVYTLLSGRLLKISAGVYEDVTTEVLGGGTAFDPYGVVRVSPDGHRIAFLEDVSAAPRIAVYDTVSKTRRRLDFKDDDPTPGLREPASFAWLSDSKTLLAVNFSPVVKISTETEALQTAATVGYASISQTFDTTQDGKYFVYERSAMLRVGVAK